MQTYFLSVLSVLRVASGPRVRLAGCWGALNRLVVYSTDCSKRWSQCLSYCLVLCGLFCGAICFVSCLVSFCVFQCSFFYYYPLRILSNQTL